MNNSLYVTLSQLYRNVLHEIRVPRYICLTSTYFSVAVTKHHDQGHLENKEFVGAYSFREIRASLGMKSAQQAGRAGNPHFIPQTGSRESKLGMTYDVDS